MKIFGCHSESNLLQTSCLSAPPKILYVCGKHLLFKHSPSNHDGEKEGRQVCINEQRWVNKGLCDVLKQIFCSISLRSWLVIWCDQSSTHTWSTIIEYLKLCTKCSLTTWTIYKRLSYLTVSASAGASLIDHSQATYACSVWWILQQKPPSRVPGTTSLISEDNSTLKHTSSWLGEICGTV